MHLLGSLPFIAIALATFGGGCATISNKCGCDDDRPKTLLEWSTKKEKDQSKKSEAKSASDKDEMEAERKDKDGDAAKKEKESADESEKKDEDEKKDDDEPKPIETDRPDFTEASSTVGRGRIQVEAGYTYARDRTDGVTTQSHSYPEILLRIGLFADWFELRLGQNFGALRGEGPALGSNASGAEDFYLGTKLALTEQKKYLPETALIIQTLLPTGADEFTANKIMPGANYLFGWDVIEDCLSCGGSFQVNRAVDDVNHYYAEVAQSFTVGYTLTRKLGAYTEWFAFYPAGAISPDVGPEHYFDGGFTYKVTPNFQLDIRAGVGLNKHAENFFAGSGFAVRY